MQYCCYTFTFTYPFSAEVVGATTDDFSSSFLLFSQFSTALWDLANSRPVHSLRCLPSPFFCLPCFLPPSPCLAGWFWPDPMNGRHVLTAATRRKQKNKMAYQCWCCIPLHNCFIHVNPLRRVEQGNTEGYTWIPDRAKRSVYRNVVRYPTRLF